MVPPPESAQESGLPRRSYTIPVPGDDDTQSDKPMVVPRPPEVDGMLSTKTKIYPSIAPSLTDRSSTDAFPAETEKSAEKPQQLSHQEQVPDNNNNNSVAFMAPSAGSGTMENTRGSARLRKLKPTPFLEQWTDMRRQLETITRVSPTPVVDPDIDSKISDWEAQGAEFKADLDQVDPLLGEKFSKWMAEAARKMRIQNVAPAADE
jgi:hypothetical protein